jgi:hypothetical protein
MRNVYLKKPDPIVRIKTYSSKASAVAAEKLVAKRLGYPKKGVNAATGEEVDVWTTKWAEVIEAEDGKFGFVSEDGTGKIHGDEFKEKKPPGIP